MPKSNRVLSHRSVATSAGNHRDLRYELERALEQLCRYCPEDLRGTVAHEELVTLMPRVQEAIEDLEGIEKRRPLTEEELAQRHAIRLLLRRPR